MTAAIAFGYVLLIGVLYVLLAWLMRYVKRKR